MKIAILGYGRMGKQIEKLALAADHEIVLKTSDLSDRKENAAALRSAEVAIEFSLPAVALDNIKHCLEAGIPVVCGTTGWLKKGANGNGVYGPVENWVKENKGAFFYASNFSVGVNVFFHLNRFLAGMVSDLPDYAVDLEEIHHLHKLDAPSGTAITLAEGIIDRHGSIEDWQLAAEIWPAGHPKAKTHPAKDNPAEGSPSADRSKGEIFASMESRTLAITARRVGETPGTHVVSYRSAVDHLRIEHVAHGREGFARGALAAAEWLVGKRGIFGMDDLLGFGRTRTSPSRSEE